MKFKDLHEQEKQTHSGCLFSLRLECSPAVYKLAHGFWVSCLTEPPMSNVVGACEPCTRFGTKFIKESPLR